MNIAILVTSLNSGGAERIAGLLSKELSKEYTVYLFLLSTENIVYEYGGTIVDVGVVNPFYEEAILYYKQKYKIEVSISFLEIMNFANIRTKRNDRVIVSERCTQSLIYPALEAQTYKIKKYYPYADEVVACSWGVKFDLEKNYGIGNEISVIYNFINKDNILSKAKEKLDCNLEEFLEGKEFFVNVGRLHEQKNQHRLIEQFEVFYQKNKNYKLLIIGSGELQQKLTSLIEKKKMENSIKIIPYISNPFAIIKRAKAMIVSSHYEGLPNAILEAMTIECPIVSTDCLAGPRELLADCIDYNVALDPIYIGKRGILVSDSESENIKTTTYMADALQRIAEDDELRKRLCENQKNYIEQYENINIIKKWVSIIKKVKSNQGNDKGFENENIDSEKKVFIYGAGKIGTSYYNYLKDSYQIEGFIITQKEGEKDFYMGIPVYEIEDFPFDSNEVQIIIGVGDNTQDEVVRTLNRKGYRNIIFPSLNLNKMEEQK